MQVRSESVSEVMSHPALVIDPYWAVSEVFRVSELQRVHHFPVVDRGSLVGIVCTCDLRDAPPGELVGKYLRRDVATIEATRDAAEAGRLMVERGVGSAVVIDAEGVCGIVTRADLYLKTGATDVLAEKCAACGSQEHLRSGPGGCLFCVECVERARCDDWFDVGDGG